MEGLVIKHMKDVESSLGAITKLLKETDKYPNMTDGFGRLTKMFRKYNKFLKGDRPDES